MLLQQPSDPVHSMNQKIIFHRGHKKDFILESPISIQKVQCTSRLSKSIILALIFKWNRQILLTLSPNNRVLIIFILPNFHSRMSKI